MRHRLGILLAIPLALGPMAERATLCATYSTGRRGNTRKLEIVRRYRVPVKKGKKSQASLPVMMSFWGATNQQVVLKSDFTYDVRPDKIETTAENIREPRRFHRLTWDAPPTRKIRVTQNLTVEMSWSNRLYTTARLPYPEHVLKKYAASLREDKKITPKHPDVVAAARTLAAKAPYAEEAVQRACDWVNDNIKFKSGSPGECETVLSTRRGNCVGMANLACAIARGMGIPAEPVVATFVGSNGGHIFMEVYFPDAGWVFYDPCNGDRGFKSLDCCITVGSGFRTTDPRRIRWHRGMGRTTKDLIPFQEVRTLRKPILRRGPTTGNVLGVRVIHSKPPPGTKVRTVSLSGLIMDLTVPSGVREYAGAATPPGEARAKSDSTVAGKASKGKVKARRAPGAGELGLAKAYLAAGKRKRAAEIYRKIIRKHPESDAAKTARAQLQALRQRP